MKKQPIEKSFLDGMVGDIKANHAACEAGDRDNSFFTFGQVNWSVDRLIEGGHAVVYKAWPSGCCAWVRDFIIDGVPIVRSGELLDETAVPKLLKQGRR